MRRLDHFSLLAPFYDRIFAGLNPARLRELLALPAGRLLDVGGGTGRVSAALVGQADLIVVTDLSAAMLRATRAKDGLCPARAHAERLPFPDASFDRVLVVDAFHHFCDQERAAGELLRILAPGGRLVIEEPNIERWQVKLIALGERLALMGSRFHRPEAMRRLFEARGGRVTLQVDDTINIWVLVEKPGGQASAMLISGREKAEMSEPEALRAAVLRRMSRVIDPETGVDIVWMRLIEDLAVDEQGRVSYTFRPSSPLCPIAVPLAIEIRRAVREVVGVTSQTTRVEGYARGDELTALLGELDGEHERASENGAAAASAANVRRA